LALQLATAAGGALVVSAEPWLVQILTRVEWVEWEAVEGPIACLAFVHSV
jgi:hypothetical protein